MQGLMNKHYTYYIPPVNTSPVSQLLNDCIIGIQKLDVVTFWNIGSNLSDTVTFIPICHAHSSSAVSLRCEKYVVKSIASSNRTAQERCVKLHERQPAILAKYEIVLFPSHITEDPSAAQLTRRRQVGFTGAEQRGRSDTGKVQGPNNP